MRWCSITVTLLIWILLILILFKFKLNYNWFKLFLQQTLWVGARFAYNKISYFLYMKSPHVKRNIESDEEKRGKIGHWKIPLYFVLVLISLRWDLVAGNLEKFRYLSIFTIFWSLEKNPLQLKSILYLSLYRKATVMFYIP